MTLNNAADWWTAVDKNWPKLRDILYRYLPMSDHEDIDSEILLYPLSKHVEELKERKDIKLERYFQAAWGAAPDSSSIHAIPCWGLLCDLCSECWVLYPDEGFHNEKD